MPETPEAPTSYDDVLYPGRSFPRTHPDRLATLATLFGMQPAPVARCRVLELGCGTGGNLLPMAFGLPESTFVGIDLAVQAVAEGQAAVEALGLENLTLQCLDLLDVPDDFGSFDYIIAHGLYSWVPEAVRDRALALCRALLTPQGVAYVSYRVYPGAYTSQMTREMMRFHASRFEETRKQISQGRALLHLLVDAQPDESLYRAVLAYEADRVQTTLDGHLYHDVLSDVNAPCYFHQFAAHAARHGLQFLAEADFYEMQDQHLSPSARKTLEAVGHDPILREQYLDFFTFKTFRRTLLCHQEVALERDVDPGRLRALFVAAPVRPVAPEAEGSAASIETFAGVQGVVVGTDDVLGKAVLRVLGAQWPRALSFDEVLEHAHAAIGAPSQAAPFEEGAGAVEAFLLRLYAMNFLELRTHRLPLVLTVSERPCASPLVRFQVRGSSLVNNQCGHVVQVESPVEGHLLSWLDGTRDRAALVELLAGLARTGLFTVQVDGAPLTDPARRDEAMGGLLDDLLAGLAGKGLLIA